MRSVDHDVLAELLADGAGLGLAGIGRAEDLADLLDGVLAGIDEDKAAFLAGLLLVVVRKRRRPVTGHELDDLVELLVTDGRSDEFAQRILHLLIDIEAELHSQRLRSAVACRGFELALQDGLDGSVEVFRFCHAHAMDLCADNSEARCGEDVDDIAGARTGEFEVIGLDDHKRALGFGRAHVDCVGDQSAVLRAVGTPELQDLRYRLGRATHHDRGFEVLHLAARIDDVVAEGVADGFAGVVAGANGPDGLRHLLDRVRAFKQEHHDAATATRLGFRPVVRGHVIGNQLSLRFLDILRIANHRDKLVGQLLARSKHACRNDFKSGAGDDATNDAAGTGLGDGVGIDECECQFVSHVM